MGMILGPTTVVPSLREIAGELHNYYTIQNCCENRSSKNIITLTIIMLCTCVIEYVVKRIMSCMIIDLRMILNNYRAQLLYVQFANVTLLLCVYV